MEWLWEDSQKQPNTIVLSPDRQQVMFHPTYSNGTALVKGNRPFPLDYQHYWEIKILSDCYGTDIVRYLILISFIIITVTVIKI